MTDKRDLKRLIRERQAKTGESYVTARSQLLARRAQPKKEPAFPVVEMTDVTEMAKSLGMKCQTAMTSSLVSSVEPKDVLARLKAALTGTKDDPQLERMRRLVFRGEDSPLPETDAASWRSELRQFITRVNAGIGGVSTSGSLVAFPAKSGLVLAHAGIPVALADSENPRAQLLLTGGDDKIVWADLLVAALRFRR